MKQTGYVSRAMADSRCCDVCASLDGTPHEPPHQDCTSDGGCRCVLVPFRQPMKVRTLVHVSEHDRFVIAKFFAAAAPDGSADAVRTRATRKQVRRFVAHALSVVAKDHAAVLRGRARAAASRLASTTTDETHVEALPEPVEKQLSLY